MTQVDAKGMDLVGLFILQEHRPSLVSARRGEDRELFHTVFLKVSFLHILNIHIR